MPEPGRGTEIRVGLFVTAAAVVALGVTLWIAGSSMLTRRVPYEVAMPRAGGVGVGDRVHLAGVEVGRIEEVELRPGEERPVIFRVGIDREIRLGSGASARFVSESLLGTGVLEIDPGPPGAPALPPGGRIEGAEAADLGQALASLTGLSDQLGELVEKAGDLLDQVSARVDPLLGRFELLLSDENLEAITGTLAGLQGTVDETGGQLATLLDKLDGAAAGLEGGAEALPELTDDLSALVADLRRALGPDGERLVALLEQAEGTLASAGGALDTVGGGRADLEAALVDLRDATANLRSLSQSLKERPSSLLGIKSRPDRRPGEGVEKRPGERERGEREKGGSP